MVNDVGDRPLLLISTSLNPTSRSRRLIEAARGAAEEDGRSTEVLDLRDYPLPLCDGTFSQESDVVQTLAAHIQAASSVVLGLPVYNYSVNATAKNLVEHTGNAWNDKIVGFVCAAGGRASAMAPMALATSLMLDFRCLVIPRFVYAARDDFDAEGPVEKVRERIQQLVRATERLAGSWP